MFFFVSPPPLGQLLVLYYSRWQKLATHLGIVRIYRDLQTGVRFDRDRHIRLICTATGRQGGSVEAVKILAYL
jgi:hypothetical protein